MSQIPQGAVPIVFSTDRREVDKFLAELRQGYVVPVRPQFQGGSAGYNGHASPYAAQAVGPASGGSNAMSQQATATDAAWMRAMQASQRAAQQAERDASELGQPSGGGGRFRLSRYTVAGFAAFTAFGIARANAEYGHDSRLAYDQRSQLEANLKFQNALPGGWLVSNSDARIYAERRLQEVEGADELTEIRAARSRNEQRLLGRAYVSEGVGFERQRRSARDAFDQTQAELIERRNTESAKIIELDRPKIAEINERFGRRLAELRGGGGYTPAREASIRKKWDAELAVIRRDRDSALTTLSRSTQHDTDEAAETRDDVLRDVDRQTAEQAAAYRRDYASRQIDFRTSAVVATLEGNRDPLGAQLAGIGGKFYQGVTSNPGNFAAQWAFMSAQMTAAFKEAMRDAGRESGRLSSEGNVLNALIGHRGLDAELARIEGERQSAVDALPSGGISGLLFSPVRAGINYVSGLRGTYARQSAQEALDSRRLELGADIRELQIHNSLAGTPEGRAIQGQAFHAEFDALSAARADFLDPRFHGANVPALLQRGQEHLKSLRQDYMNSFQAEEVNPNRTALTGAGTENAGDTMKAIQKAIEDLAKVPDKLDAIADKLNNLVAQ